MVVAFGQSNGVAQSIVLLILELAMMLATGIIKPFMTKGANVFAIIATVLNSLNAIFFLVFSNVFNQPTLMTGILGVLYFIFNAASLSRFSYTSWLAWSTLSSPRRPTPNTGLWPMTVTPSAGLEPEGQLSWTTSRRLQEARIRRLTRTSLSLTLLHPVMRMSQWRPGDRIMMLWILRCHCSRAVMTVVGAGRRLLCF